MKIAVIGATGGIGQKVVEQALEKGHEVIAISRGVQALLITDERLEKRPADASNVESIKNAIDGADVVVSALGTNIIKQPTTVCSDGITNIISAMQALSLKRRLIAVGAAGYVNHPKQTFLVDFLQKYLAQKFLRYIFDDLMQMEAVIRTSDLDWTVVRPPRLTNGKHTRKYRENDEIVIGGLSISRADVADFIVSHLTDEKTFRKEIGVAY
ncbi:MAG TPA: SDR family oxidoreductase [Pyrinomonadaceae bacterium]|nr:SDR family oxidoreductase [Pyrinomonadaceae bacterium]